MSAGRKISTFGVPSVSSDDVVRYLEQLPRHKYQSCLPSVYCSVSEMLTPADIVQMASALKGRRLKVPVKVKEGSQLVRLVGTSNATALVTLHAGLMVKFPSCRHLASRARREKMLTLRKAGKSNNYIAAALGMTNDAVSRTLSKMTRDTQ